MTNPVSIVPTVQDSLFGQSPRQPAGDIGVVTAVAAAPTVTPQADLRLVIEETPAGQFIYKTLDRRTGEIVRQLPREDLLRLREDVQYASGALINAKA